MEEKSSNQTEQQDVSSMRQAVLKWLDESKKQVKKNAPKKKTRVFKKHKTSNPPKQAPSPSRSTSHLTKVHIPTATAAPTPVKVELNKKTGLTAERSNRLPKFLKKILNGVWVLIVLLIVGFGAAIYAFGASGPSTQLVSRIIPYPAALVNFRPVFVSEWINRLSQLDRLSQQSQVQMPASVKTAALDQLIDDLIVKQLASQYGIIVTPEEVSNEVKLLTAEVGSRVALESQLAETYGWSVTEFEHEIVIPLIRKDKVQLALNYDQRINASTREQAEKILAQVQQGTESFSSLANRYSEDFTAIQGGDLGYFSKGQMVPEFEQAVFALQPGEISGIITTRFGHHIVKVEEQLVDDEGNVTQVRARHILVRTVNLDDYIEQYKKTNRIWRFVH